ncbi:heterokaryon incompatibility protein-domain-containing protein, partial [Diaporthe sp. PMI_573]
QFVLTEVEIDPTRTKQTSMLTSVRRPILPCVDLALVQKWLDDCRNPSQQANTTQRFFTDGFRLIDVIDGRLILQKKPCEYVALSYVWGQAASFNLCTNNENLLDLCQPSSFYKPYNEHGVCRRLPKTIADAMSLCRSIGQRYLWVDSFCIVQDDVEEKRRLIHGMNRVYENANLTLVALSGVDADAGLAGISPRGRGVDNGDREYLFHETYETCCIGIGRISLIEQIRPSHWNTRGWTYQEQLLSPRKLYFAPGEVFYECNRQQLREGYAFENLSELSVRCGAPWHGSHRDWDPLKDAAPMNTLREMVNPGAQRASYVQGLDVQFQRIVSLYTRRQLKNPGDILHAVTGVYNRFFASSDMHGICINVLQGIPMRCFSRALLWFPKPSRSKRSDSCGTNPSTWSWIYWITAVDF